MSKILRGLTEARITSYGPGDPETWPAYSGHPNDPRDPPRRGRQEPDDYDREPYNPMDDYYKKQDAAQAKYNKEVKVEYSDKEGVAPNGERYNSAFVVRASNPYQGDNEIRKFEDLHWGAKKIVDTVKKEPSNAGEPYITAVYYVDNHKYGTWRPWKDEAPTQKPLTFENPVEQFGKVLEGISQEDLANTLCHRIEMRYPDIYKKYDYDAMYNAVDDVASFHAGAEELGSSDINMMIRQVFKRLEESEGLAEGYSELDNLKDKFEKRIASIIARAKAEGRPLTDREKKAIAILKGENKEVKEGSEWETRHDEFVTVGDRATPEQIDKIVKALIDASKQASGKRGFLNQIVGKQSNGDLARMAHGAETLAKNIQRNRNAKTGTDERKELGQHLVYAVSLLKKMSGKQGVAEGSGPQAGDEVYYGNRLVGWFKGYSKYGKIITEPNVKEIGDEYFNKDVYWEPQEDLTIKPKQGVAEEKGTLWRIHQSEATGRYHVVKGYNKDIKMFKNKMGAGDFNSKEAAQAKADELNSNVSEDQLDELKCWDGYKRVPGTTAGEPGSCEKIKEGDLNELSTDRLAKYKTASAADARAADKAGDFARGNKRFAGIVKATKKQFDNETKPKKESAIMKGLVDENLGTPYPGTYEQEFGPFKRKGSERTMKLTTEGKKNVSRRT